MPLIFVTRKADKQLVRIPEHWLDHPRLGAAFKRRPSDPVSVAERAASRREVANNSPAKAEEEN